MRGEIRQHCFAGQVLQRDRGVDQSASEEDRAGRGAGRVMILLGKRDDPARERDAVDPRQGVTARRQFFANHAPTRFFDCGEAAPGESASKLDLPPLEQPEMTKRPVR